MSEVKRTFVIGDIHGAFQAFIQVLDKCNFDSQNDLLIAVGDFCDGWSETNKVIDHLISLPNKVCLLGNHDQWLLDWAKTGKIERIHLRNGGQSTLDAYGNNHRKVSKEHIKFLEELKPMCCIEHDNAKILFVHGGIPLQYSSFSFEELDKIPVEELIWERDLYDHIKHGGEVPDWGIEMLVIGHCPTRSRKPEVYKRLINIDTGAGWNGYLTIMNIETLEYWQSDPVQELYPDEPGRMGSW